MTKARRLNDVSNSIFDNINVGIYRNTPGPAGRFVEVNSAFLKIFGYSNKKRFLQQVCTADLYRNPAQRKKFSDALLKKGFVRGRRLILKRKDGSTFHASITATVVKDRHGKVKWFDGIVEDTESQHRHEKRFQLIYEHSPIAIWEENFSAFAKLLATLKRQGVKDIRGYLMNHHSIVQKTFRKIKILDVNKAALHLYGAQSKQQLIAHFGKTLTKDAYKIVVEEFVALAKGERFFEAEFKSRTLNGKLYDVLLRVSVPDGYERSFARIIVTIQDITQRKKLERHLKRLAQLDSLTKLLNSRALSKRLYEEYVRAKRYSLDLSCLMIDIDHFKTVNDRFGHQKGDVILKHVARMVKTGMRESDIVGRYGGDEFFVILTETKPQHALVAAERIRRVIAAKSFHVQKNVNINTTISIGISGYPGTDIKDHADLIAQADAALYRAKDAGRNCVK